MNFRLCKKCNVKQKWGWITWRCSVVSRRQKPIIIGWSTEVPSSSLILSLEFSGSSICVLKGFSKNFKTLNISSFRIGVWIGYVYPTSAKFNPRAHKTHEFGAANRLPSWTHTTERIIDWKSLVYFLNITVNPWAEFSKYFCLLTISALNVFFSSSLIIMKKKFHGIFLNSQGFFLVKISKFGWHKKSDQIKI